MAEHVEYGKIVDGPSSETLDPELNPVTFQAQDPDARCQPYRVDFNIDVMADKLGLGDGVKEIIGNVPSTQGGEFERAGKGTRANIIYNTNARSGWISWTTWTW